MFEIILKYNLIQHFQHTLIQTNNYGHQWRIYWGGGWGFPPLGKFF